VKCALSFFFVFVVAVCAMKAQQSDMSTHEVHDSTELIAGTHHQELVPDLTAWRLYLLSLRGTDPDHVGKSVASSSQLRRLKLDREHTERFTLEVVKFKTRYDNFISEYNEIVYAALRRGEMPDFETLLRERDTIVADTQERIKVALGDTNYGQLHAVIDSEKLRMKVVPTRPTAGGAIR
jgi:hypothetical protein